MFTEIATGLQAAKSAYEIAKGIQSLKSENEVNSAVLDIQRMALDAQASLGQAHDRQTTLTKTIDDLEKEIMRLKDWSAEKQRYELADTGQGTLAYRVKVGMEEGEPAHWLCPTCYQKSEKSLLQHETHSVGRVQVMICHPCGNEIITRGWRDTEARNPQRRR